MRIGFLGFGNIAQAMAQGLSNKKLKDELFASSLNYNTLVEDTKKYNIHPCKTNDELVDNSDIIIVCVKPDQVKKVLKKFNLENKIIISFAAGIFCKELDDIIPNTSHITVIPNTAMSVNSGVLLAENEHTLNPQDLKIVEKLLSKVGMVEFIETKKMDIATVIAGCGPAYVAMFIEALGDAGCRYGLDRETSYRLASKMMEGTGKMAYTTNKHPAQLKDAVCSPKGSTIRGVIALEKQGFRGAVIEAVDKVMDD